MKSVPASGDNVKTFRIESLFPWKLRRAGVSCSWWIAQGSQGKEEVNLAFEGSQSEMHAPVDSREMASFGSEIPDDLLSLIIAKFLEDCSLSDYIRFPAVCAEWNKASYVDHNLERLKLPTRLPLLMFVTKRNFHSIRSFFSLSERKVLNYQVHLPRRKVVRNSSHGWLVTIDVSDNQQQRSTVWLHNPFKTFNKDIRLPPLAPMYPYDRPQTNRWVTTYLKKAILSANPSSLSSPNSNSNNNNRSKDHDDHIVIMAINTRYSTVHATRIEMQGLMFCKLPNDDSACWYCFTSPYESSHGGFEDVIYYKGWFHTVLQSGLVVAFDAGPLHYPELKHTIVAQPPTKKGLFPWLRIYLIESNGDLLQVHRYTKDLRHGRHTIITPKHYRTVRFEVFKLLLQDGHRPVLGSSEAPDDEWVQIHSLNGRMLFLGDNASLSLLASDFPGCKPNCIYFNDDHARYNHTVRCKGGPDCGAFNLEDGVIERFPISYRRATNRGVAPNTKAPTPEPIWIEMTI